MQLLDMAKAGAQHLYRHRALRHCELQGTIRRRHVPHRGGEQRVVQRQARQIADASHGRVQIDPSVRPDIQRQLLQLRPGGGAIGTQLSGEPGQGVRIDPHPGGGQGAADRGFQRAAFFRIARDGGAIRGVFQGGAQTGTGGDRRRFKHDQCRGAAFQDHAHRIRGSVGGIAHPDHTPTTGQRHRSGLIRQRAHFLARQFGDQKRVVQRPRHDPHQHFGSVSDHSGIVAVQQHHPARSGIAQETRHLRGTELHRVSRPPIRRDD